MFHNDALVFQKVAAIVLFLFETKVGVILSYATNKLGVINNFGHGILAANNRNNLILILKSSEVEVSASSHVKGMRYLSGLPSWLN